MAHVEPKATFTAGDTRALLDLTLKDPEASNAVVDITGMTLKLNVKPVRGTGTVADITGTIQGAGTGGKVRFDCRTIASAGADLYLCQVDLQDGVPENQRGEDFYIAVKAAV